VLTRSWTATTPIPSWIRPLCGRTSGRWPAKAETQNKGGFNPVATFPKRTCEKEPQGCATLGPPIGVLILTGQSTIVSSSRRTWCGPGAVRFLTCSSKISIPHDHRIYKSCHRVERTIIAIVARFDRHAVTTSPSSTLRLYDLEALHVDSPRAGLVATKCRHWWRWLLRT